MALLFCNGGEIVALTRVLQGGTANNYNLRLFSSPHVPAAGDTAATYTPIEANFTGYVVGTGKLLTAANWGAPTIVGGIASSTYTGPAQTWTNTGAAQTIYGYFVTDNVTTALLWAEQFASARTLNTNDTLNLTPVVTLT
jgi:hypothetical protein